jgi:hypothetical protein
MYRFQTSPIETPWTLGALAPSHLTFTWGNKFYGSPKYGVTYGLDHRQEFFMGLDFSPCRRSFFLLISSMSAGKILCGIGTLGILGFTTVKVLSRRFLSPSGRAYYCSRDGAQTSNSYRQFAVTAPNFFIRCLCPALPGDDSLGPHVLLSNHGTFNRGLRDGVVEAHRVGRCLSC